MGMDDESGDLAAKYQIPKDKGFPCGSVQCDDCGGFGCATCHDKGWLTPKDNPNGRRCMNPECRKSLPPDHVAVYCSNECAFDDA